MISISHWPWPRILIQMEGDILVKPPWTHLTHVPYASYFARTQEHKFCNLVYHSFLNRNHSNAHTLLLHIQDIILNQQLDHISFLSTSSRTPTMDSTLAYSTRNPTQSPILHPHFATHAHTTIHSFHGNQSSHQIHSLYINWCWPCLQDASSTPY